MVSQKNRTCFPGGKMKKEISDKMQIGMLYIWKKFRDAQIRTKLAVYVVLVALICSGVIGSISYVTMRNVMIHTARKSSMSLLKQMGSRMDDRIREFQDTTYSFSNSVEVRSLLYEGGNEEFTTHTYNLKQADLSKNFLTFTVLHNYSEFVIVESRKDNVYFYDQRPQNKKITLPEAENIMEELRETVTDTLPIQWIKKDGQLFFVRRIVRQAEGKIETVGTIIFGVSDDFLLQEDDGDAYVTGKNILVAGDDGVIYKKNHLELSEKDLTYYFSYREGKYYIYNTVREINSARYLVLVLKTPRYHWNMCCFIPYKDILAEANQVIPKILLTTVVLLSVGLLIGVILYRNIRKNLNIIEQGMQQYESGNYSRLISPASYDEIGLLILQFNHMGMKINELNELTRKEEEEKQELQYQVMEAQINPHFLYNTLGSLKWLAYEKEQDEIARLADAIISLLRFTVKYANQEILLEEELSYIDNYIYIQQTRYENTFCVEKEVTKEALAFPIIGFILQPFVENNILHGLDNARTDGVIRIKGEVKEEVLYLTVADNGFGMTPEKLSELQNKIEQNKAEKYRGFNGIGVINIILRLKLVYGEQFRYRIDSEVGAGTSTTLMIPKRRVENEKESIVS